MLPYSFYSTPASSQQFSRSVILITQTGRPPSSTVLHFIVLHRDCLFYRLKVCGNSASSPFSQQCLLTLSSRSYSGDSHNISFLQFTIIIIFAREIAHQWSLILLLQKDYDLLKALMMVSIFFTN